MTSARAVEYPLFEGYRAPKAVGPLTPSVVVGNNADLIAAIAHLYLDERTVLDVTYGKGAWWARHRPDRFQAHDLHTLDGVDFTNLPYPDRSWGTVCYDPPYIPAGGRGTSTVGEYRDAFGLDARGDGDLRSLCFAGLAETARVAADFLLVKCMDYVVSGRFTPMTYRMWEEAERIGLHLHDEIVLNAGSGPGGHNIVTQLRARRAHSKLLVFTHEPR